MMILLLLFLGSMFELIDLFNMKILLYQKTKQNKTHAQDKIPSK